MLKKGYLSSLLRLKLASSQIMISLLLTLDKTIPLNLSLQIFSLFNLLMTIDKTGTTMIYQRREYCNNKMINGCPSSQG